MDFLDVTRKIQELDDASNDAKENVANWKKNVDRVEKFLSEKKQQVVELNLKNEGLLF